jgi:hypothetical protein
MLFVNLKTKGNSLGRKEEEEKNLELLPSSYRIEPEAPITEANRLCFEMVGIVK